MPERVTKRKKTKNKGKGEDREVSRGKKTRKLTEAKREEAKEEGKSERDKSKSKSKAYDDGNGNDDENRGGNENGNGSGGNGQLWSSNPHIEQAPYFYHSPSSSRPPSSLLQKTHSIAILTATLGFILSIVGMLCYTWSQQARSVGIFSSAVVGGCLVFGLGVLGEWGGFLGRMWKREGREGDGSRSRSRSKLIDWSGEGTRRG